MRVRGDIECVNLSTGERFQRVVGNGESRMESLGRPLNAQEQAAIKAFEREMQDKVIPAIERTIRRRAEAAAENRHKILFLERTNSQ